MNVGFGVKLSLLKMSHTVSSFLRSTLNISSVHIYLKSLNYCNFPEFFFFFCSFFIKDVWDLVKKSLPFSLNIYWQGLYNFVFFLSVQLGSNLVTIIKKRAILWKTEIMFHYPCEKLLSTAFSIEFCLPLFHEKKR